MGIDAKIKQKREFNLLKQNIKEAVILSNQIKENWFKAFTWLRFNITDVLSSDL
jgi:hypothetical protein